MISGMLFGYSLNAKAEGYGSEKESYGLTSTQAGEELEEVDYSLEDIAALNNVAVENLITRFDANGRLTFLGNTYCNDKITNGEEALASLDHLNSLLMLDDVELSLRRVDVSPISGYTYYLFDQVLTLEKDGKEEPAIFFPTQVKVIVDASGISRGVSAYLMPLNNDLRAMGYDFLTKDEAHEIVKSCAADGVHIYEDMTVFKYWDDIGTAVHYSYGNQIPTYQIITDATQEDQELPWTRKYKVYVVYALAAGLENDEDYIVSTYLTDHMAFSDNAMNSYPTQDSVFDGMECGGEYTYVLSTEWAQKLSPDYPMEASYEVTVPVMYDPQTQLYYLADVNREIAVTNFYDYGYNFVVSDNPADLDSWHFVIPTKEESDGEESYTIEYFMDPNYVIGSYNTLIQVYDMFADCYGFNSVGSDGLPILLKVYWCDGAYPESEMDFVRNAANEGKLNGWNVITTSPSSGCAIETEVMAHEYTHGINFQLTTFDYSNEPGAMVEGFADIIAILLVNQYEDHGWTFGGRFEQPIRIVNDPTLLNKPMYKYGPNYAQTFENDNTVLMPYLDNGGVHYNSGIPSYAAYIMNKMPESELREGEERLSFAKDLDLWFETMYMTTLGTDFEDMGHYLALASAAVGLNEGQRKLAMRVVDEYGFLGHYETLQNKIDASEQVNYYYTFDCGDSNFLDSHRIGIRNAISEGETSVNSVAPFEVNRNGVNKLTLTQHMPIIPKLFIADREENQMQSVIYLSDDFDNIQMTTNFVIHVREEHVQVGQTFYPHANETVVGIEEYVRSAHPEVCEKGIISFDMEGVFYISTKTPSMKAGEYNLICVVVSND